MTLKLTLASPCPAYLDETTRNSLAMRPQSLEGKTVGLLPNWRPAAVHILKAVGALLIERCGVKEIILEKPVHVAPMTKGGTLLDGMRDQLDSLASRVDVVIAASGD